MGSEMCIRDSVYRTRLEGTLSAGCLVEVPPADAPAESPAMSARHDRVCDAFVGELHRPLTASDAVVLRRRYVASLTRAAPDASKHLQFFLHIHVCGIYPLG